MVRALLLLLLLADALFAIKFQFRLIRMSGAMKKAMIVGFIGHGVVTNHYCIFLSFPKKRW